MSVEVSQMEIADRLSVAIKRIERLREALEPFSEYYKVNDCYWRSGDDALEVPIRDLREAAFALQETAD